MNFFSWLKLSIKDTTKVSKFNILSLGIIGSTGHPLYWVIWTYIFPEGHDDAILRFSGAFICILFLLKKYWSKNLQEYFPIFWFFSVAYVLPFIFTAHLIINQFSDIWLMCQIGMFFMVAIFIHNFFLMLINLLLGIGLAILYCFLFFPETIGFELEYLKYIPIFTFAIIGGFVFSYTSVMGIASEERSKILQSLGGSIAHEMRNPLGSIKQSSIILTDKIQNFINSKNIKSNSSAHKYLIDILKISELISRSSNRGSMMIDMILSNIQGKQIDQNKFKIFKICDIVNIAMTEFAFEEGEKEKCLIDIQNNFYFKGDENMMIFVLFNLLKNALFYLKLYPKSKITIYNKKETNNKNFNHLYFKDTGAGIPNDKLESIFESFMTSGKEGGTGLGLPFCRRVITAFNGTIICNSELEKYTEFVIKLPKITQKEENKQLFNNIKMDNKNIKTETIIKENYSNKKTILIVDDQSTNRIVTGSRLKQLNFQVIKAKHGQDALDILNKEGDKIDLILMDLNMPEMDGYETTKLIKLGNKNKAGDKFDDNNFKNYQNIPIIAFTGDNDDKTRKKIRESGMNDLLGKDWNNNDLLKMLKKCLMQDI